MDKKCCKCKSKKSANCFYKSNREKDGLQSHCKQCALVYQRGSNKYKRYRNTIKGRLREVYRGISYRCNNIRSPAYKNYGGRGIKNKFESFDEFFDYVVGKLKISPAGLTIDRIDNNGHYEKGNIRFVTKAENNRNKRGR